MFQQTTKKKIAKEILIFFFSIVFIGLVISFVWMRNLWTDNKIENLKITAFRLDSEIDSIKNTFPTIKAFENIFGRQFTSEEFGYEIQNDGDTVYITESFGELPTRGDMELPEHSQLGRRNTVKLYKILKTTKFSFSDDGIGFVPDFADFNKEIRKELSDQTINLDSVAFNKPQLARIYNHLKTSGQIKIPLSEFVLILNGLPPIPSEGTWSTLEQLEQERKTVNLKLNEFRTDVNSREDIGNILLLTTIITAVLVYPIRLIIWTIIWAFKTVREK